MCRKILITVLFVVVFIILPVVVGSATQHFLGKWVYSVSAGVGTWFLFAIILMLVEFRIAKPIDENLDQ